MTVPKIYRFKDCQILKYIVLLDSRDTRNQLVKTSNCPISQKRPKSRGERTPDVS